MDFQWGWRAFLRGAVVIRPNVLKTNGIINLLARGVCKKEGKAVELWREMEALRSWQWQLHPMEHFNKQSQENMAKTHNKSLSIQYTWVTPIHPSLVSSYLPRSHPWRSPTCSWCGSSRPATCTSSSGGCRCMGQRGRPDWSGCCCASQRGWSVHLRSDWKL